MRETEVATPVRPHTGLYHLKLAYLASPRGKDKPGVNTCSTPFNRLSPLSSSRFPLHQRFEHLRIIEARQPSSSYLGSLKMQRYDDGDGCVANLFERMLTRENGGVEGGIKRRERERRGASTCRATYAGSHYGTRARKGRENRNRVKVRFHGRFPV